MNAQDVVMLNAIAPPYGRSELRQFAQRAMTMGMTFSTAVMLATVGTYHLVEYLQSEDEAPTVRIRMKYSELGPPPSLQAAETLPTVGVQSNAIKPSIGIPVPVPDAEVNPDQTFASQTELSAEQNPALRDNEADGAGGISIEQDIQIDEPGMDEFIPVEKEPMVVRAVKPKYPQIAQMAGIEGTVWVKILVGKDGRPKRAVIMKEIPEGTFREASLEAAMQYIFTPAYMNSGPVQVWTAVRFKFVLQTTPS
ncbi:MAG: hypothetical protein A3H45_04050 [Ignavibacteria bacterium RIFCSPLOWO2_02_FULL_55_14]|nr:MAG: hypothetical protein A3H45_04050 [Ignavibacteria bacterium RIFCSPLOWO2_02_FULL_55_14]OGU76426.1 MAG: hypothetical protein A3G43_00270 [Ignavibacteria bacterium RIFCSPLOWO2_12_FULL_56_21]HAV23985.1 hypothetical protein [Bacteroidota bacterium]